jgi:hypothetical protein
MNLLRKAIAYRNAKHPYIPHKHLPCVRPLLRLHPRHLWIWGTPARGLRDRISKMRRIDLMKCEYVVGTHTSSGGGSI